MSVKDELTVIQRSLEDLDRAIGRLEQRLGKGALDVRRLRADAGHLREDLALLRAGAAPPVEPPLQMVTVSDTPYDPSLWKDADDEGLGCRDRRAP